MLFLFSIIPTKTLPYAVIDNDNVKVLQILDLLKNLDRYLDCSYEEARKK